LDFEDFCPIYRPELFSLAKRYTGQDHTADDLVQETLLKAYRHWDNFKQETTDIQKDVKAWLKKILTNTFYTEWQRDQRRSQTTEEYGLELDTSPSEDFESEETLRVKKVMDKLRPMYREVLDLHYLQDKSYQEIADLLGIKFVQVQKRLYRARQYIKTFYEQAGLNRRRLPMRVNPTALEPTQTEQSEADTVDCVVTGNDTKPLRRRKARPDADAAR
jgi:RNA polymerase sigma-70 factor, ECF subfamily